MVLNTDDAPTRRMVESCYRTTSTMVNPIIEWSDSEVWEWLGVNGCEGNPLYEQGNTRVGCIGCPMSGPKGMKRDFARYPKYRALYVKAFDGMLEERRKRGKAIPEMWVDGESVMRWWYRDDPAQVNIYDFIEMLKEEGLYD